MAQTSYVYPTTRIQIIAGGRDTSSAPYHASDYYNKVLASGSPLVSSLVVASMGHPIAYSQAGLNALAAALLWSG